MHYVIGYNRNLSFHRACPNTSKYIYSKSFYYSYTTSFTVESKNKSSAMAENRSKFVNLINIGYKCCLTLGIAALLIAYRDVRYKEDSLSNEVASLRAKLESDTRLRRRRSIGLDNLFRDLNTRFDSLERRCNTTDAFLKIGNSPYAALLPILRGPAGPPGKKGEKGDTDTSTGSVTYIRWGKSSCPKIPGTKHIYSGVAAGQHYTDTGGMSNTLCLHLQPSYERYSDSADTNQWIYGVEYEVSNFNLFSKPLHDHDAPCSVCRAESRGSKVMIPGRNICPNGWTAEYKGYLMSAHYGHKGRTTAVCVDMDAEGRSGSYEDKNGNLWYFIQSSCGSLPCGPYVHGRELTCVVCTK